MALGRRLVEAEHGASMSGETGNGPATLPRDLKACRGRSYISGASPGWRYWERIEGRAVRLAEEAARRRFTTSPGAAPALRARDYEDAHRARKGHDIRRTYSGTGMKTARYIPPEGELSVWCFVHQLAIEQERGLQLAGLLLTPFPRRRPIGLTRDEFRTVGKVRARLAVYRQLGALPEGGVSWIWPDGPRPTPVVCQSEEWLKAKMAGCCCFNLRVPRPITRLRSHS